MIENAIVNNLSDRSISFVMFHRSVEAHMDIQTTRKAVFGRKNFNTVLLQFPEILKNSKPTRKKYTKG